MIIDSFIYPFSNNPGGIPVKKINARITQTTPNLTETSKTFTSSGVDSVISIVSTNSEEESNRLLNQAQDHKLISGIIGWTDLMSDYLPENLDKIKHQTIIKGFTHIPGNNELKDIRPRSPLIRGLKVLKVYNYSFDLSIYSEQIGDALNLIDELADSKLVLNTLTLPSVKEAGYSEWKRCLNEIGTYKNVMCRIPAWISGSSEYKSEYNFYSVMNHFMEMFGPGRLIFGSGLTGATDIYKYKYLVTQVKDWLSRFPKSDQEDILGMNAQRFYRIDEPDAGNNK